MRVLAEHRPMMVKVVLMKIVLQPPIRVAILALIACSAQNLRCEAADLADGLQAGGAGLEKVAASWPTLPGAAGGQMRREWKPADRVFGARVARALATFSGSKLERVDVMYADAPTVGAGFAAVAAQLTAGLPPAIDKALGVAGQAGTVEATMAPGSLVTDWSAPAAKVRLVVEPAKRVWMTLYSGNGAPATASPAPVLRPVLTGRSLLRTNSAM